MNEKLIKQLQENKIAVENLDKCLKVNYKYWRDIQYIKNRIEMLKSKL